MRQEVAYKGSEKPVEKSYYFEQQQLTAHNVTPKALSFLR